MSLDLPLIWAGVIALAVFLYVSLDGFDLGIGILFAFARSPADRDTMMATIAPYWDGNETWLVLGGGGLFAAFPGAYAALMPAFYLPIILMLLALILRGVAFEFRARGRRRGKRLWTILFAAGSILAALAQGLVLGGFVHGVSLKDGLFVGGAFDWATPYAALTALGLVAGYALLGAGWLMIKTRDELHGDARRWARAAATLVAMLLVAVSLATLVVEPHVAARWGWTGSGFDIAPAGAPCADPDPGRRRVWRSCSPGLVRGVHMAGRSLGPPSSSSPATSASPPASSPMSRPITLTYRDAANDPRALGLLFGGLVFILPVILGYTVWVYWVFRGKTAADAGYH